MAQPLPEQSWPTFPSPLAVDPRLLTVSEYLELGETEHGYSELVEGRVVMSPSPLMDHNHVAVELLRRIAPHVAPDQEVLLDVDIDLELVPGDRPGFSRRPDLIVVSREARLRQRDEGGIARASEVALVVEILSPASVRTDHVAKRSDYADAGIPHYWILDLSGPVTLLAYHLAGEFGYADGGVVTGRVPIAEPFAAEIDLDALL
ncbi:MAG: Uma2 family endonuclease [Pseudonocardia sp.]|nr:Uma2 family endonuclease [Pseudonocardia sp.]